MSFLDSLKQLFGSSDAAPTEGGDMPAGEACPHCGSTTGCDCASKMAEAPAAEAPAEEAAPVVEETPAAAPAVEEPAAEETPEAPAEETPAEESSEESAA